MMKTLTLNKVYCEYMWKMPTNRTKSKTLMEYVMKTLTLNKFDCDYIQDRLLEIIYASTREN